MRKTNRKPKEKPEFEQQILDLSRVTRVTKGGKVLSFRVCIVIGNKKGKVGYGLAKGKDVQIAVSKAEHQAKKNLISVPMVNGTVPHQLIHKFKSSTVLLKPAPKGSGIIAGGALRALLELAGVENVSAKIMGKTKNNVTVVKAAFEALKIFKAEEKSPRFKATEGQGKEKTAVKPSEKKVASKKKEAEKK